MIRSPRGLFQNEKKIWLVNSSPGWRVSNDSFTEEHRANENGPRKRESRVHAMNTLLFRYIGDIQIMYRALKERRGYDRVNISGVSVNRVDLAAEDSS